MSMIDKVLAAPQIVRRQFFITALAGVVALLAVRFLIVPFWCGQGCVDLQVGKFHFLAFLLEELAKALLVAFVAGLLVWWLGPRANQLPSIVPIEPRHVTALMREAMTDTKEWRFRGGTGSFLKAETLPALANAARRLKRRIRVTAEIINPVDRGACEAYASYRRSLSAASDSGDAVWSAHRVAVNCLSTVLTGCVYRHEQPLIELEIGLTSRFSTFRYDLASQYVILTSEDKRSPSLRVDAGTFFYEAFRHDLEISLEQSARVAFDMSRGISRAELTPASAREQLRQVGVSAERFSDDDLVEAIELVERPVNPYA
jgi:hypothetical protein